MKQKLPIIGITHGDYNGINYEILLKIFADNRIAELCTPILYGSTKILGFYQKLLQIEIALPQHTITHPSEAKEGHLNIVPVTNEPEDLQIQPGALNPLAGLLAAHALRDARRDLISHDIHAVVTLPINKDLTYSADFPFKGHTEFFGEPFTETPMMLFATRGGLRVGLLTTHVPFKEVSEQLSQERIVDYIKHLRINLQRDFLLQEPKIAVTGLNPHAGENGLLGSEEKEIISPALASLWQEGYLAFGPYPADGFWGNGSYIHFDAIVAMNHDSGLLPFKLLAMEDGVNITSGLPILRTSPDHGTAYDIAGKGKASPNATLAAIYMAIDIHRNRNIHTEITKNPLEITPRQRSKEDGFA